MPAALALAVAVFIPRTALAARAQPKAPDASLSRLAELTSARWIFLVAAYFLFAAGYISYSTFAGVMLKGIGLSSGGVTWESSLSAMRRAKSPDSKAAPRAAHRRRRLLRPDADNDVMIGAGVEHMGLISIGSNVAHAGAGTGTLIQRV